MARLLNRAYERLNKILSLSGSQAINDIDLDQAFGVHQLNDIAQNQALVPVIGYRTLTVGAGNTDDVDLDPFGAAFTSILDLRDGGLLDNDSFPAKDWDFQLTHVSAVITPAADPLNFASCQFFIEDSAGAADDGSALTPLMSTLDGARDYVIPDNPGDRYYWMPMPMWYFQRYNLKGQVTAAGGGNVTVGFRVYGSFVPRGLASLT